MFLTNFLTMLSKRNFLVSLIFINVMFILFIYPYFSFDKYIIKIQKALSIYKENILGNYYPNNHWMINNKMMQYSSYIIQEKNSDMIKIESMVKIKDTNNNIENINLVCLIKSMTTGEIKRSEAFEKRNSTHLHVKRIIFKIYLEELNDIDLDDMAIAIIKKEDFSDVLNKTMEFDQGSYLLPYRMINFQKPKLIMVEESRIKNIAMCVPFTYSKGSIPNKEYEKWNKNFGIGQLVLFDATSNKMLLNSVDTNDKTVEVRPYCLEYECICTTQYLSFTDANDTSVYLEICKQLFGEFFKHVYSIRTAHEDLTINDCFLTMSYKYEFISLYDFDEFVFPRTTNDTKLNNEKSNYICEKEIKLCREKPFAMTLYEFVIKIVEKYFDYDIDKLSYILIPHAVYLNDIEAVKFLIKSLDELAFKIENNLLDKNQSFPIKLALAFNHFRSHIFLVEKEDFDHVIYLSKQLKVFSCYATNYLSGIKSLNKELFRFLYLITHGMERLPKSIYYYKNVYSVGAHDALYKTHPDSKYFQVPDDSNYILAHFRNDIKDVLNSMYPGSIRKLKIDYEYMAFLLQNYTSYCDFTEKSY